METPDDPKSASPQPYADAHIDRLLESVRAIRHPTEIGPFHIVRVIGEGGMGIVYEARQIEPIKRTVAIKIIKLGMDTREVIARFESERQALAMMNHPNVAKVLDAGATETGRPYFVMELVEGLPITRFCDEHRLTIFQRLELLIQACDAVQHAHQKAIIHRDLKPSNILVSMEDEKPRVKVIDFGVAKAISQRLTEKTLFTQTGQLVGTPEYMAPEQANVAGADVDTRSDVYSLGVVLYELLSGALPFNATSLRSAGYQSIQRVIRDVDPPRPSTRLSGLGKDGLEIARLRHSSLEALAQQLGGELEWIPLKAMRKDRGDRYATATELAEDIRNYLEHRPLRAGPESAIYRAKKFLRRNKTGVAASAVMLLLLIAGIVATSLEASRAIRAERATRAALDDAKSANASMQAVNDFLTEDLLWSAQPERTHGREMTVREAVDIAAKDVGGRFAQSPQVEASVRTALAGTYNKLGRADLGLPQAEAATQLIRQLHHEDQSDGLETSEIRGELLESAGQRADAERIIRQTLDGRRKLLGDDHPLTITSQLVLAHLLEGAGSFTDADALDHNALSRAQRAHGERSDIALDAMEANASLLRAEGKFQDAEKLARDAVELSRQLHGDDHLRTIEAMDRHALLLARLQNFKEAEPLMRKIIADRTRIQGVDHPDTLQATDVLASYLSENGRVNDAEPIESDVVQRARRVLGDSHPFTLSMINNFGRIEQRLGKLAESESLCREALAGNERTLGKENPETLTVAINLAFLLHQEGKLDDSETMLRGVIDTQRRVLGNDHPVTLAGINNLGGLLFERRKFAEAESLFREALAGRRKAFGDGNIETLGAISNLGRTLEAQGRLTDAEPLFAELYHGSQTAQIPARQAALFMSHWGETLAKLGKFANADAPLNDVHDRLLATNQQRSDYMLRNLSALAEVCDHANRPDEAAKFRTEIESLKASTRPSSQSAH